MILYYSALHYTMIYYNILYIYTHVYMYIVIYTYLLKRRTTIHLEKTTGKAWETQDQDDCPACDISQGL